MPEASVTLDDSTDLRRLAIQIALLALLRSGALTAVHSKDRLLVMNMRVRVPSVCSTALLRRPISDVQPSCLSSLPNSLFLGCLFRKTCACDPAR